jgi:hypothetical protein
MGDLGDDPSASKAVHQRSPVVNSWVARNKKADEVEHFHRVGLLINEPPGAAELLFI